MNAEKPSLLLIDDEERILRSLAMLFRGQYGVHITTDPQEALAIVQRGPIHVVVSDQKMPRMRGSDLLREIRVKSPNSMRILLTGYSEMDAIVDSVNEGEIFRYVSKPWDANELRSTVAQAADIARDLFAAPPPVAGAAPVIDAASDPIQDAGALVLIPMRPSPETSAATAARFSPAPLQPAGATPDGILVVDDDIGVFHAVQDIIGSSQPVYWAHSLDQMFALLAEHAIGVIVAELTVKRENIATALKMLKAQHPDVVTVVMTPFQDAATLIGLINEGQIFRLLPKPVRRGPLSMNLASALRHHRLLRASPRQRERYVVEKARVTGEPGIASRVLGLLGRLRNRPQTV